MNFAAASNPKIQSPAESREAALAEGALNPAGRRRPRPAPRRRGGESLGPRRAGAWAGAGTRTGTGDRRPESEGGRARGPCPRLPETAAASSSPRSAPAGCAARGGSQSSSQHVVRGSLMPLEGQRRAAPGGGGSAAERSGNGAGRPARGKRGGPASPGGGRVRPPPRPRPPGLRPASRPRAPPRPAPRAPPRLPLEALGLALTLEGAGPTGQSVNCAETCPDPRLRGFRAQFSEFLA